MSKRLKELRQRQHDLKQEATALLDAADKDGRDLTEAEEARYSECEAQLQELAEDIAAEERKDDRRRTLDSIITAPPPAGGAIETIETATGADREDLTGFMARYANLPERAFETRPGQTLSHAQLAAFGDMLIATARAGQNRGIDPLLIEASLGANETVAEDGGFLVESDIADGLLMRTFDIAMIANRARRIPLSARSNGMKINAIKDNSRATGSRYGGVQAYWIGEGDSITPSRPKFRQMNLELKKLAGLIYVTSELLQDSVALAAVVAEAFPLEFGFMLDDAMFEGAGGSTPLGFLNGGGKVAIAKETGQAAATILFENVNKMYARMPARSIANAEWWVNQDCMPALMELHQVIGTGGVPVYLPPGGLSQSPYGTLLGRPVMPLEYCSTLGTEGDIVFADPTSYVMIDKGDIQRATSMHVAFTTDETAFRFTYRVDGQPIDNQPITPFKGSASLSTFVTLATRS